MLRHSRLTIHVSRCVSSDKPFRMKKKNILIAGIASLVVMAATTYLVIKRRTERRGDVPPGGAPQVPINNPGDQSDFPAGPSAEPGLG